MQTRDIRLLKLLEAVGREKPASQRALAKQLDMSLGLVNGFLKKLIRDGFCSVSKSSANGRKYSLTSDGMAEKSRLAYDYILLSYARYKEAQQMLVGVFKKLEYKNLKQVVFYGINDFAEIAYLSMKKTSVEMVAAVDKEKAGHSFFGITIENPSALRDYSFDRILITENTASARQLAQDLYRDGFGGKVAILTASNNLSSLDFT